MWATLTSSAFVRTRPTNSSMRFGGCPAAAIRLGASMRVGMGGSLPSARRDKIAAPSMKAALVTCARLPDLDPDDHPLRDELTRRGHEVTAAIWDDANVDWRGFDIAVLR